MKLIFITAAAVSLTLLAALLPATSPNTSEAGEILNQLNSRKLSAVACSPDFSQLTFSAEQVASMVPLPGTGSHKWQITTSHDSAVFYFNQGINLYYGFHIIEAIPSFKKAIQFDPNAAMLHWAEALSYGPNINDLGYAASPEALSAIEKAVQLSVNANEKDRLLITAMASRYSRDSSISRTTLNESYANAMRNVYKRYPDDPEVGALYADALMLLHPWDLWFHDGKPKPWTNEIVSVLEHVLKLSPEHPGANHYYIHAIEASPFAAKATASADRLGKLTPGLSHMVHMPSHIYIRTGEYQKGVTVNREAVLQYQRYLSMFPEVAANAPLYDFHNRHMQAVCSMNADVYTTAIKEAMECRSSVDTALLSLPAPLGPFIQYVYMTPEFTKVYFEKWDEILSEPDYNKTGYSALIKHFSTGMAYANKGQLLKSIQALNKLELLMEDKDLALPFGPFNAPRSAAVVAQQILKGTILEKQGEKEAALQQFRSAVANEDALIYNEPKDWILPARHFLGFALINMRKFPEAQKVFREDLKQNPKNPKSEKGLAMARSGKTG